MTQYDEENNRELNFHGKKIDVSSKDREKDKMEVNFMGKKITVSKKSSYIDENDENKKIILKKNWKK